jgi:XTP/dITP diphosphohydrolase
MSSRLVLLVTTPRVAPGALTWDAWSALRAGPVFTRDQDHPQRLPLEAAGVAVEAVDPTLPAVGLARLLRSAAGESGVATWLAGAGGDEDVARALGEVATQSADAGQDIEIEVVHGNWDLPGARVLDVVATMDRLRSPGGCPWDAEQTHETLGPYLLEEAYEAFQAIEDRDDTALREELGDVLLQVAFHARLAEENEAAESWSIDDVAGDLVDKLVRRHPHVFGDHEVTTAAELEANWDAIKSAEKGRTSPVEGVPMAMAALTLAATLQRKVEKAGAAQEISAPELAAADSPGEAIAGAAASYDVQRSVEAAGALLWTVVAALRRDGIDAEAALRARSREFRDSLAAD